METRFPTKPLFEIADVRAGSPAPQGDEYFDPNGIPFVRVQDIGRYGRTMALTETKDRINQHAIDSLRPVFGKKGTIVFPKSGAAINTNSRAILGVDAYVVSHLAMVNACEDIALTDWLYFYLCSVDMGQFSRTAALPSLRLSELRELPIPCPELNEQRRIVAHIQECMDRVEKIEGLRAEALQERDYLLESLIEAEYQQVEGETVTLADVCSITSSLVDPREQQYIDQLHIGGGNIETKTGKLLDLKTARQEDLKSNKFTFDGTMVLYNKIRPYLMKVARPDFSGLCSADMYPLSPDPKKLTRDYLFYLLLSRKFTNYAVDGSNRAGMPKVNRKHLFEYKFTLPSIEKQHQITEALDVALFSVEGLRANMTESASEANALHQSILRKAFAGEL